MVRQRARASARDWHRMVELQIAARAQRPHAAHLGDLLWRSGLCLGEYDPACDVRLWEWPDGALAAYAVLYPAGPDLAYELHPRARTPAFEAEVLAWGVARMAAWLGQGPPGPREDRHLAVQVPDDDGLRLSVQTRLEFEPTPGRLVHLVRPLDLPIPAPVPPPGFTLRQLAGAREAAAYVEAHRDAWEGSRMRLERHLWLMGAPGYRRPLNLVAVAPDGTLAATLIGWLDPVNRAGGIEPLGVRPAFRRMGLGRDRAGGTAALPAVRRRHGRGVGRRRPQPAGHRLVRGPGVPGGGARAHPESAPPGPGRRPGAGVTQISPPRGSGVAADTTLWASGRMCPAGRRREPGTDCRCGGQS